MYLPKTPKTPNLLVDKNSPKIPGKNPWQKPPTKSSVNAVNRT